MRTRNVIVAAVLLTAALILVTVLGQSGHVGKYRIPVLIHHDAPLPPKAKLPPTPTGATPCAAKPKGFQDHSMSQCLPKPVGVKPDPVTPHSLPRNTTSSIGAVNVAYVPALKGSDRSNNDPLFGLAYWQRVRASGVRYTYLKATEGTGFVDSTAQPMATAARAAGVATGGYDFAHVCNNAVTEATLFVARLRADGLVPSRGQLILNPVLDVEYPSSTPCNGAAWVNTHRATVFALLHVQEDIYTGKWYWDPHIGCFWPSNARGWVSGYGSLPVPCGLPRTSIWQYTDAGWDGAGNVDMNDWIAGSSDFVKAQGGALVPTCCREGDRGQSVWLETHRLAASNWLSRSGTFYSYHVALVVRAYQLQHKLSPATGVTGPRTWNAIRVTAYRCRKYHRHDRVKPL